MCGVQESQSFDFAPNVNQPILTKKEKRNISLKAYRETHKEQRAAYNKMYNATHKEQVTKYATEYRAAHVGQHTAYMREYRKDNPQYVAKGKEGRKNWYLAHPEYRDRRMLEQREIRVSPQGILYNKEYSAEWRKRDKELGNGYKRLGKEISKAVKDGIIIKPMKCSVCDSEKRLHAHHDDYSKPLDVRWLCVTCHGAFHRTQV